MFRTLLVPLDRSRSPNRRWDRRPRSHAQQLADVGRRLHDESGMEIETAVVVEPHVGPAILDVARARGVDLIAMSTYGRGLSRFLMGSVADKVLRGGGLPMLLFRPLGVQARVHLVEVGGDAYTTTATPG
jgi:nucleotide-binding universal stress UspA family protein